MARWRYGATPRGGTAPDGPVTEDGAGAASARVSEMVCALDVLADNIDPAESCKAFRGRIPSADALLRNRGLK